jgi:hypothetical protein
MQTDDILFLIDSNFATAKKKAIIDSKIMIKSRDNLDSNSSLKFNDMIIERQENDIYLNQISSFDHLLLGIPPFTYYQPTSPGHLTLCSIVSPQTLIDS